MAAPLVVQGAGGANARHLTLDVQEAQILLGMEGDGVTEPYEHFVLLTRLRPGVWICAAPDGTLSVDDLAAEDEVIPLPRAGAFPIQGRPFLCHGTHSDAEMSALRAQAMRLAEIHGAAVGPVAAAAAGDVETCWVYSDPAQKEFSKEVPIATLATAGRVETRGAVGLVQMDAVGGAAAVWTTMERLKRSDLTAWMTEKREGPGRDRRLTTTRAVVGKPLPLFRDAVGKFDPAAVVNPVFEGPSAVDEVTKSASSSGLEPAGFAAEFLRESGVGQRSGISIEYMYHWWTLWAMAVYDGFDLRHSVAAEHVARRIMQQQRAIRKSPKSPDFDHLEAYVQHSTDTRGLVKSTRFDQHISSVQRDEAFIMKNQRLTREEVENLNKRKPKNEKNDKDG